MLQSMESQRVRHNLVTKQQQQLNWEKHQQRLMLKLKLQYFGHLMRRTDSLEKTLMLGKIENRRRGGQQRTTWLNSINQLKRHESEQTPGYSEGQGSLACCNPWGCKELNTT